MSLGPSFLSALDRIRCGAIVLDGTGRVLLSNVTASDLLGDHSQDDAPIREQLKELIRAGASRFRLDSEDWIMVPRDGRRPIAIHALPGGTSEDPYVQTILILVDLENHPQPSPLALRRMFNLTAAEASLAILVAQGESPADIARTKNVSLATVRTQLGAIFAKTQTRRQADLVALLARIAILP